jgi:hypothetical protein
MGKETSWDGPDETFIGKEKFGDNNESASSFYGNFHLAGTGRKLKLVFPEQAQFEEPDEDANGRNSMT